ncbi:uncharacterized protein [Haliotis asinina]|uniref:uncharacterized protein n=1 Tax=Haliotis asinina TaxID=109174 RepID=UPI0035319AA7
MWNYSTNITDKNKQRMVDANLEEAAFTKESATNASMFEWWNYQNATLQRWFATIADIGIAAMPDKVKLKRLNNILSEMEEIYSTGKVCVKDDMCLELEPGLTRLMATSRDYWELTNAWRGWREQTGNKMKDLYAEFVVLSNEAIRANGYNDTGAYWRSWYESDTFAYDVEQLFLQLEPLYIQLHAYTRRHLKKVYGEEIFPKEGHIPAHLLGNMWAQSWNNLLDILQPFKDKESVDVTPQMKAQNYTALRMFHTADDFFRSLGMKPMPQPFWNRSMIEKPKDGRSVVCHASAWDFYNGRDFRVKMCTDITMLDLITIHHEMGHVEYFLQYMHQPVVFRAGANPGFHEAVGDVLALSVATPKHLQSIGLLSNVEEDEESDINYMLSMALDKIAFLPFGYLMDQWRWSVFSGETPQSFYNTKWWSLRCRYQGISPPVERSEDDFDPGAKYHIPANTPYIRYFVSFVIQFQFHKALCQAANHTGPLYKCDIYRSREAGALLSRALELGSSRPWPEVMQIITGQDKMDAGPLMEYFQPLTDWLKAQNEGHETGWKHECPEKIPVPSSTSLMTLSLMTFVSSLLLLFFTLGVMHAQLCLAQFCAIWVLLVSGQLITDLDQARQFLNEQDAASGRMKYWSSLKEWEYYTNITDENSDAMVAADLKLAEFTKESGRNASLFAWKNFQDETLRRRFSIVADIGTAAMPDEKKLKRLKELVTEMEDIYFEGKVCVKEDKCLDMDSGLARLMSSSRNYGELTKAWKGWRDQTGKKMKNMYAEFVSLNNEAIRANGYEDTGAWWRSWYETDTFTQDLEQLFLQLEPLYIQLHAYTRRKLMEVYGKNVFPREGHIPAHLLGNMWAQTWVNLLGILQPYKNKQSVDVTPQMEAQGYTPRRMFETADDFFTSLGMEPMTQLFWKNSMIEEPKDGRSVDCYASAWDFYNGRDFRMQMCTDITMEDLLTVHYQMAHIQYYQQYKNQPVVFRSGANPGFQEAVGNAVTLSVATPKHLKKIGLLTDVEDDPETDINYMLRVALDKIAFLPFGYLMDQWRWSVFSGETPQRFYNTKWWSLRCRYQGISPPVERSEYDFDPGAKYHIPANTPYIRYFVGFVLQFQFHKALCQAANHTGPLHRCDIYQSKEAGALLSRVLELGKSRPWPEAMQILTGQNKMDARPLMEYFQPLTDWLKEQNRGHIIGWEHMCPDSIPMSASATSARVTRAIFLVSIVTAVLSFTLGVMRAQLCLAQFSAISVLLVSGQLITDLDQARQFLDEQDAASGRMYYWSIVKAWNYYTNITDENRNAMVAADLKLAEFTKESGRNASLFAWKNFQDETLRRRFSVVADIGTAAMPDEKKLKRLKDVLTEMEEIYSTGKVCVKDDQCLDLEPGLTRLMSSSRNYGELTKAWKGWRDQTGKKIKNMYAEFVALSNEAIRANGYEDTGAWWRSWYETDTFTQDLEQLFLQLEPLYIQLHAYTRRKLMEVYGKNVFPREGHIPAHLLGNMWAQTWGNLLSILQPYKNKQSVDVTPQMKAQGYTPLRMFQTAEEFFTSLGMEPMTQLFWEKSMIEKPKDGRSVVCHASAWDFYNGSDFRIKQCTDITMEDLITVHHEMGHIQYYQQYMNQPVAFRDGANPGFHEAVGDVLALSAATPKHLKKIGLLTDVEDDAESDINYMLSMALDKIAFLPFGYLMDQWRWSVFSGQTPQSLYNTKWWSLRCRYQGISPPVPRTEDDFDPGAKYHIPANVPYIRYFVSFIIQFQFHKALCQAANQTGPLHRCDIYQSREAGALLSRVLELGSSRPWPEAMQILTGQNKMDARPLMEYFQPLTDWLKEQNRGHIIGWEHMCPDSIPMSASATSARVTHAIFLVTIATAVLRSVRSSLDSPFDVVQVCPPPHGILTTVRGIGGATVARMKAEVDALDAAFQGIVFFQVGENDVSPSADPRDLVEDLLDLLDYLRFTLGVMRAQLCLAQFSAISVLLVSGQLITDLDRARQFLDEQDAASGRMYYWSKVKKWNYYTNITDKNRNAMVAADLKLAEFTKESGRNASLFAWKNFQDETLRRRFSVVADIGTAAMPDEKKLKRLKDVLTEMEEIYSTGKVCVKDDQCLDLEPGLTRLMSSSRNYGELTKAWKGWRDQTGKKMKNMYAEFVSLNNEAIRANGYEDTGVWWRSWYETDTFTQDLEQLFLQLEPLYIQLHAYTRRKLMEVYGKKVFPREGHIPAHLLGNMWAQSWGNLLSILQPYKNKQSVDVTPQMKAQGYTPLRMFQTAEEFFTSLGMEPMTQLFWEKSMIEKPKDGRSVVCHASAWDFYNGSDFRIKQCTDITMEDLIIVHHEMGHIQYYQQYMNQPVAFRDGANYGFHEAVGDVLALSAATPKHLKKIGLLTDVEDDAESDINYMLSMALDKIAFLPFGYLMDQWRWSVFSGQTPQNLYNTKWWSLRCRYQGISPPVPRTEDDFDPGAKYHIPANVPYIRYFLSRIIQFQFHKALCQVANQTGPLHRCDIYQSREAGALLSRVLELGSSRPWPEAMQILTGQNKMDARPIMEYFQPLTDWLKEQNRGHIIGWEHMCPDSIPMSASATSARVTHAIFLVTIVTAVLRYL